MNQNVELLNAAPLLFAFLGAFLVCFIGLSVVAIYFIDRAFKDSRMLACQAIEQCQKVATAVILASSGLNPNGINPHVVDPERFGPTGMSRRDEPTATPTTKGDSEELSEEELALREAEAEYAAQRSVYNDDGSRRVGRVTRAPGAPPGADAST